MTLPDLPRELTENLEPEVKRRLKRAYDKWEELPEPTESDLSNLLEFLRTENEEWHERISNHRKVRYMTADLPEYLKKDMRGDLSIQTRMIHNEIVRIVGLLLRSGPRYRVLAANNTQRERDKALKQERWLNHMLQGLELSQNEAILRPAVDNQIGDSMGYLEVFMTEAWDDLDEEWFRQKEAESDKDYDDRVMSAITQRPPPFGVRPVDPLSVWTEKDTGGVKRAMIVEDKPIPVVFDEIEKAGGEPDMMFPDYRDKGYPSYNQHASTSHADTMETVRYYDRRWYVYMVDGQVVDGPRPHYMPDCPVIDIEGMVTGSPEKHERYQMATWGMERIDLALSRTLSIRQDQQLAMGRVRLYVWTPPGARVQPDNPMDPSGKPAVLDFSDYDDGEVPQLWVGGQEIKNVYGEVKPYTDEQLISILMGLFQRSGLNPVAQGESPGADTAGYTINALLNVSQAAYEIYPQNLARALARLGNFARLLIRDTIQEKVYWMVQMQDRKKKGIEWLALGPDDVTEVPCFVEMTPLKDMNQLANRQSLMQGHASGYVPRRLVQEAYGAEDPGDWDEEMWEDDLEAALKPLAIEEAQEQVMMRRQAQQKAPILGPTGEPLQPTQREAGQPAPIEEPTVGAENAEASRASVGGNGYNASRALAGQDRGYRPEELQG